MRSCLAAAAAILWTAPAAAQDEASPEPASPFTITGGASLVTDYRFRGISQSDENIALQGTLSVSHESGFYVSVWGSSIDEHVANGADAELDLIAGYRHTWGGTTLDAGVLYYYYPGSGGANTDFIEPFVSIAHAFGPATAKVTANYAPSQSALTVGNGSEDNLYLAGDLSVGIPNTPVTVSGHFGHSFGPSFLTIGDEYSDWSVNTTFVWRNLSFGVAYVDTDGTFITPSGRNASDATVVGSVSVSF
jgi:uncharacterized protein (TIGR02001 family)